MIDYCASLFKGLLEYCDVVLDSGRYAKFLIRCDKEFEEHKALFKKVEVLSKDVAFGGYKVSRFSYQEMSVVAIIGDVDRLSNYIEENYEVFSVDNPLLLSLFVKDLDLDIYPLCDKVLLSNLLLAANEDSYEGTDFFDVLGCFEPFLCFVLTEDHYLNDFDVRAASEILYWSLIR